MSELTDAMDAYADAVERHRGSREVGWVRKEPTPSPSELSSRDFVEACCEQAVPDHVWEFWSHPLLDDAHQGWAPYANTLIGAEGLFRSNHNLFIDAPFHPDVQIPLMKATDWPFLVDRFDVPGDLWLGWVGADADTLHRFALTLPQMFSTWSEGLNAGLLYIATLEGDQRGRVQLTLDDSATWPELPVRLAYSRDGYVGDLPPSLLEELSVGVPDADDYDAWFSDIPLNAVHRRRARFEELTGAPYPRLSWE